MSYITTMAVGSGIVMAADRQITQHAEFPRLSVPDSLNGMLPENIFERIYDKNSEVVKAISHFSRPLSKSRQKLFTMGDNIGVCMGQTMCTDKKFPVDLLVGNFCKTHTFDKPEEAAKALCEYLAMKDPNLGTLLHLAGYNKTGRIEADEGYFHGRIEADEGYFHGHIEALSGTFSGELNAQFINIGGTVAAGTNYVIRSNNSPIVKIPGYSTGTVKELVTAARGTATVRVTIRLGTPPNQNQGATYSVQLRVNGSTAATLTPGTGFTSYTHEENITLNQEVNIISLYYTTASENTIFSTFELRCTENPRFLRFLG